jgi:hypothetical protein
MKTPHPPSRLTDAQLAAVTSAPRHLGGGTAALR